MKKYTFIFAGILLALLISGYAALTINYNQHQPVILTHEQIQKSIESEPSMLSYVNDFRKAKGLNELVEIPELDNTAKIKAEDEANLNYYNHTRPNGEGFEVMIAANYIHNGRVGENLAKGDTSIKDLMNGWYASPKHKENILDPTWKSFGSAYVYDQDQEAYYFVNHFSD